MEKEKYFEEINDILTSRQERFCRNFTQNDYFYGNATLSYADAYEWDLDSYSKVKPKTPEGEGKSEYEIQYDNCSSLASRLRKNDKIQTRCLFLLNDLLKDEKVDGELARLIMQDKDLSTKLNSIKEYNKLKQRIVDRQDIKQETVDTTLTEEERQKLKQLVK